MQMYYLWIQDHLLAVTAVTVTVVLIYHYMIEKDSGVKLSKRYRQSIFEAQSKVFLNATQYLISGNKDLAIREFLNAVDINRETIDTYFALGGLFRSNGEIEKAISIHRSLIARENISENTRLKALKELAFDFDKGGFIDKAIETYKDVLKINRDQFEVINSLCRIYEDIGDWDQAYNYRIMLSKVGHENQSQTISHILVQKSKQHFENGDFGKCEEDLDDAFRFAPSVSAKMMRLRLLLTRGELTEANALLLEIIKQHPLYASFVFVSLGETFQGPEDMLKSYTLRLESLKSYFLEIKDAESLGFPSVVLSKVRLLKDKDRVQEAYDILKDWIRQNSAPSEVLRIEYVKLLIKLGKTDEAVAYTTELLEGLHKSLTRHFCRSCGYNSDDIFWRCPQCHEWETIQFRWKV
jgi:lipopolysaccharide biosynthesis regulator YciM